MLNKLRILISRPDRIGDVVLSTPIPKAIKEKYPNAFVTILLRKYTKDIYANNPFVDKIIVLDEFGSDYELIKAIRKENFTHSLSLLPTEKINWILFFAGIKKRVGVGRKFYQFISNTKFVNRLKYKNLRSEADYSLDLIRKIGIDYSDTSSKIYLTEAEIEQAISLRKKYNANDQKLLVGVHISSGNSAPNMPIDEYKKLITELSKDKRVKLFVTDDKKVDWELSEEIVWLNSGNSLRQSIVNISILDYFISASTGPMHLAGALGVKTLSLFCPEIACSPKLWGTQGNKSYFILPEENYCKNSCSGDTHNCDFQGAGGIDANIVINQFRKLSSNENIACSEQF